MSRSDKSGDRKPSGRQGGNARKKSYARGNAPFSKKHTGVPSSKVSDEIRLNKYISNSGICSRREADIYIASGNVTVNGKVVDELGYKVKRTDKVRFDGRLINPDRKEYILLNKPKGFFTAMKNEKGSRTVADLIANATEVKIAPVDRLERATSGLLLFTNDAELTRKLTNPAKKVRMIFHAELNKNFANDDLKKMLEGVVLEEGPVAIEDISFIDGAPRKEIGIRIEGGYSGLIRGVLEKLGYEIVRLDRVVYGGLTKKDLPRGNWRKLSKQEIINLGMI
ncbi:pseudouridine synthase [Ascidiimonas sp. W6]|uniref:pseudouridine synthase n=1 Tax=Ascidiimonas meishanensis TaxID=3128903 RepID=UPI0030EEC307